MKYVSWNCRGLGNKLKEESLKDIIRMTTPEILLIQETKLEDFDLLQASKTIWKKGQGKAVSARGASRGIGTFWDSSKFALLEEEGSTHCIYTKLLHKDSGHHLSLFNLYVPILFSEKRVCWDSLKSFLKLHNPENIIIAGDLNITLSSSKKKRGSPIRDPAREWVENLIMDWDLEDIKPARGKYTWTNKRLGLGHIAARLDRFLVQSTFLTLGLAASSKILPNYTSDHKHILLDLSSENNLGPIPFQFSPFWIHQEGFQEIISNT